MLGLRVLLHSVKLVFLNWQTALRISSPLIAIGFAFLAVFGSSSVSFDFENLPSDFPWCAVSLFGIAYVIAGLWVAVAWHRFVLLEEDSGSIVPKFRGDRIGAYLLQGILLSIIVILAALVVGTVSGLIFTLVGGMAGVFLTTLVVTGVLLWIFYRLSPTLPAAALGEALSIGDAWRKTSAYSGAILTMVIAMSVLSLLFGSIVEAFAGVSILIYGLLSVIQTWVSLMVGISVLTTIYGIAVEHREL